MTHLIQQSVRLAESALGQSFEYAEWPCSQSESFGTLRTTCTGHGEGSMASLLDVKYWAIGGNSFEQAVKFRSILITIVQDMSHNIYACVGKQQETQTKRDGREMLRCSVRHRRSTHVCKYDHFHGGTFWLFPMAMTWGIIIYNLN